MVGMPNDKNSIDNDKNRINNDKNRIKYADDHAYHYAYYYA